MTEKAPTLKLHGKLAEIMEAAERIPKNGTAPQAMGGFKFVQVGDAADFIRRELGKRKVSMLPTAIDIVSETEHETARGGTMTTLGVRTTWTLTDGETGETAVIQSYGAGADTGDKFSGKAQTNAMKYALLMGFQLSTGDDPELSDSSDRQRRAPQVAERETTDDGGLIGTAEKGRGQADYEIRQTPDGPALSFRLVQGRKGMKVLASGALASILKMNEAETLGQRVTCWGTVDYESFQKDGKDITYPVMTLERISTPTYIAPSPDEPNGLSPDVEAELDKAADAAFEAVPIAPGQVEAGLG